MAPQGERGTVLTKLRIFMPPVWCMVGGEGPTVAGFVVLHYLKYSKGVFCSTLSDMCGSWYFPRFLLRYGSFTQMYIASSMVLVTPCDSLSTMLKHLKLTAGTVV